MNVYETEEIKKFKEIVFADLFKRAGINLSFEIMLVDKENNIKIPELDQDDLNGLLSRIYLYFIEPIQKNHYQGYAYNFFDTRLAQAKCLNPSKNLYDYGMSVLQTFLHFVKKLKSFFHASYQCYMDYLGTIKTLKHLSFNEHDLFCTLITAHVE